MAITWRKVGISDYIGFSDKIRVQIFPSHDRNKARTLRDHQSHWVGRYGRRYQATDTKLGRSVAIKFLPEAFSHDTERVARFQREARVLASLNPSNIAAIHGVDEINGRHFLVMEVVTGETLAERIKRGAIPIEEGLSIAKQIAEALEEAHEKGVVHRDLKPANVKITPEGNVKVLDFGLAKALSGAPSNVTLSNSPTLTIASTNPGIILGTAAYMSPEQARSCCGSTQRCVLLRLRSLRNAHRQAAFFRTGSLGCARIRAEE